MSGHEGSNLFELGSWAVEKINHFQYTPGHMFFSSPTLTLGLSGGYLAVVGLLWLWMKDRKPFQLQYFTLVHNLIMTIASLIMFIGMTSSLLGLIFRHNDWAEIMFCDTQKQEVNQGSLYFWVYVFFLSKFYEWLDTVLMVLKKNKLGFLHVYHHWVTMLLVWLCLEDAIPTQWSAQILNTLVHIFMYYYYSMATIKVHVWWKRHITQLQITQFVLTNILHGLSYVWHYAWDGNCASFRDTWGNQIGMAIINSYLLLFLNFYATNYTKKDKEEIKKD